MEMMKTRTITIAPDGEQFVALCPLCGKIVPLRNVAFNAMIPDNTHYHGAHAILRDDRAIMSSMIYTPLSNLNEKAMYDIACDDCKLSMFIIPNAYIAKIEYALFGGLHLHVVEATRHGIIIEKHQHSFNVEIVRDLIGQFFDVYEVNDRYRELKYRTKDWTDAFIEYVDKYLIHPENYANHNWDHLRINITAYVNDEFVNELKKVVYRIKMENPTILHYMHRRTMERIETDMKFISTLLSMKESGET